MEIELNVYTTRSLKEIEKTYRVSDFKLSFGACEDVLEAINVDMFDGGLEALSEETKNSETIKMIVNALPVLKDILKDVFDGLTDEEMKRTDVREVASAVLNIVSYSLSTLGKSVGKAKN